MSSAAKVSILRIRTAGTAHVEDWIDLRDALWTARDRAGQRAEIVDMLETPGRAVGFVAYRGTDPIGFAEATLRHDYVNGCETTPVAFLEALFVKDSARRTGIARHLIAAVEAWARSLGCRELASDAAIDNLPSHAVHHAAGFAETGRVVFFRKAIDML